MVLYLQVISTRFISFLLTEVSWKRSRSSLSIHWFVTLSRYWIIFITEASQLLPSTPGFSNFDWTHAFSQLFPSFQFQPKKKLIPEWSPIPRPQRLKNLADSFVKSFVSLNLWLKRNDVGLSCLDAFWNEGDCLRHVRFGQIRWAEISFIVYASSFDKNCIIFRL